MVHIPVVMATDNRYIPLIVSVTSMLKNAGEDETLFGKNGYFGDVDCGAAKDMAEILLYHEVVRRRRQKRGML